MSVPSWVRVGAKCVCTKRGAWSDVVNGEAQPSYGQLLTIREVRDTFCDLGGVDLMFEEIVNPALLYREGHYEAGFHYSLFAPVVTKTLEQDIAQFLPLLKHQRAPEAVE